MELIYLYIRNYGDIFKNVGFNFSSNYIASFKNNFLTIENNTNSVKGYYGDNVNNVVMLFGKNGTGKTTLLNILGMRRDDRSDDTYKKNQINDRKIKHSYFILYHLYDNYFCFEFVDYSFLFENEKIINIDMQNELANSALYKLPIGTIFMLDNGIFKYCDNITLKWLRYQSIKNDVEYAYITSDRYNNKISNRYRRNHEDYMFKRNYYLGEHKYEYLYEYLIQIKKINNTVLQKNDMYVSDCIKIEFDPYDRSEELSNYLEKIKKELDKLFGLKSNIQIQMEEKLLNKKQEDKRSKKDIFFHTFYAKAIEYYFLVQFVGWYDANGKIIDIEASVPDIDDIKSEVESLNKEDKMAVDTGLMDIMNFQNEYAYLLYQVQINTDTDGNIDLKKILIYVLNRVEIAAKYIVDTLDREAVPKIITLLEELPESFFESKNEIRISCDIEKPDEKITELLRLYDYYYSVRNDDVGSNSISKLLGIKMPYMSEGSRCFLDIVSKSISAIYATSPGDSLVLLIDEPDKDLHPELARNFLDILLESISKCKDRSVQIVLTSHSPFIVTDILPEYVYAIDESNGDRKITNNNATYATNIYYLLMDSFMLENTFGEYSYKQLKKIIEELSKSDEIGALDLERIRKIIDRIGEKTVKKKLLQMYNKHDDLKSKLVKQLLSETNEEKLRKIKEVLADND